MHGRGQFSILALVLAAGALLGACGSNPIGSIGSINPFGGSAMAETDRVFLMAAGSWDRNRDSTVTCDEWKAYAAELFNGADANRDDAVDASEWGRIVAVDRMFETADLKFFDGNGDGKVARAEMIDRPNPAFKLMDTSNTCTLNSSQIAGARSKTQYDVAGKPKESGDPRDAAGQQGKVANGGAPGR